MSNASDFESSDFLIDYIDDLIKTDNSPNGPYVIWTPSNDSPLLFSYNNIDTTAQLNSNILSQKNSNTIGLTAEDIYKTVSELSVDDLNLFSPKIEIYRKLPASLTLLGEAKTSDDSTKYVYKKMDFVDGWNSFENKNKNGLRNVSINIEPSRENNILNGQSGLGVAAITDATWDLQVAQGALDQNSELFDYLGKFNFSISKFSVNFYFDSIMTFFGNSQNNNSQLITDFMLNPKANLFKMAQANIEGDDVTRNYVYLMFLADVNDENNDTNGVNSKNNELAYQFMIKVGYEPVEYNFDEMIQDENRKRRLKRFNSILRDYSDYYNLFFDCKLSNYDFKFAKDNSIKLTCEFVGSGRQGGLRDPLSYRTSNMDFLPVLESLVVDKKNNMTLDDLKNNLKNQIELVNQYETLSKTNCFDSQDTKQYKNEEFYNQLRNEVTETQNQINDLKLQSVKKILNDVKINLISLEENADNPSFVASSEAAGTANQARKAKNLKDRYKEYQNTILLDINDPQNKFDPNFANFLISNNLIKTITLFTYQNSSTTFRELAGEEKRKAQEQISGIRNSDLFFQDKESISFFFFGNLVENLLLKFKAHYKITQPIINCIMPNISIHKRTRNIIINNNIYRNNFGSDIVQINAAYVPIPMGLWRKWTNEFIVKKQRDYYHLFDLLNDLKVLLTEAINYRSTNIVQNDPVLSRLFGKPFIYSSFYQTTFNVDGSKINDFIKYFNSTKGAAQLPGLYNPKKNEFKLFDSITKSLLTNDKGFQEINIFGYVSESIIPIKQLEDIIKSTDSSEANNPISYITSAGNYEKDMKLGIIHFFIGNQLGLAKDFTFTSNVAPNGREIALAQEKRSDKEAKSINYNNVIIKIAGGNFFRPMELIYVHPHYTFGEPFDNQINMSNILNIGGYYQITDVSSTFSSKGVYETEIKAKFMVHIQANAIAKICDKQISDELRKKFEEFIGDLEYRGLSPEQRRQNGQLPEESEGQQ